MTTYAALTSILCSVKGADCYSADFVGSREHSPAGSELLWQMAKNASPGHQPFYGKGTKRKASRSTIALFQLEPRCKNCLKHFFIYVSSLN